MADGIWSSGSTMDDCGFFNLCIGSCRGTVWLRIPFFVVSQSQVQRQGLVDLSWPAMRPVKSLRPEEFRRTGFNLVDDPVDLPFTS